MQADTSKCKQSACIKLLENKAKSEQINVEGINKLSIWGLTKPKQLSENNIDNNVQRLFVKQIQENASKYKQS